MGKNISGKFGENQNTFIFNNVFSKIVPLMRKIGNMGYSRTGHRRKYNITHALCKLGN